MIEKKKTTAKKPVAGATKKTALKKPAVKKTAVKKTAAKKAVLKKTTVKKTTTKKPAVKKTVKNTVKKAVKPAIKKPAVKKTVKTPRKTSRKAAPKKTASTEAEKLAAYPSDDALIMEVESKKFEIEFGRPAPETPPGPPPAPRELEEAYGEDALCLLVRDPEWIFAYWEISEDSRRAFAIWEKPLSLRFYDVTDIVFDGRNAHRVVDVDVNRHAWSWYQQMPEPGRSWCAEIGVWEPDGRFTAICRSAAIQTPPANMASADLPTEWIFVDPNDPRRVFRIPPGVSIRDLLAASHISEEILRELRIPQGLSLKEMHAYYEDLLGPNLSSWLLGQGGAGISSWVQSYPGSRSEAPGKH